MWLREAAVAEGRNHPLSCANSVSRLLQTTMHIAMRGLTAYKTVSRVRALSPDGGMVDALASGVSDLW
ncbi:MAG TPA: hypothetical protein PK031_09060, partial [Pseudomonadales bacterium]|nr:hypothetical protein [Pseudomonadales bacterium]